jgi:hypothetical protein
MLPSFALLAVAGLYTAWLHVKRVLASEAADR